MNGGAIALGHPLGASGSRITAHVVHEIRSLPLYYFDAALLSWILKSIWQFLLLIFFLSTFRRRGLKYGIGSACIGGGQGIALLLESL